MVISPFSTFAGQARSVASAPQAGEACVLTDQEIEVRTLRTPSRLCLFMQCSNAIRAPLCDI